MKYRVSLIVERDDLDDVDTVMFSLPWTDVVGPQGEVVVVDAEKVDDDHE